MDPVQDAKWRLRKQPERTRSTLFTVRLSLNPARAGPSRDVAPRGRVIANKAINVRGIAGVQAISADGLSIGSTSTGDDRGKLLGLWLGFLGQLVASDRVRVTRSRRPACGR
jgi:hypothetical protein